MAIGKDFMAEILKNSNPAGSPSPKLISQLYAPVVRASNNSNDANWTTLATIKVPGGTMNLNGKIVIEQDWKFTASANQKRLRIDWGGGWVSGPLLSNATATTAFFAVTIKNNGSLSNQFLIDTAEYVYGIGTAAQEVTPTVNTAQDVAIDIKCSWGTNVASEQIILRGYSIWYYPGAL